MIIIVGESGSGKTSILNELVKIGYEKAVNYTTRPKRIGEEDKKEYEFVTKSEFENMWEKNKLVQRAEFNGQFYGMGMQSLKETVACISIVDSIPDIKSKAYVLGKNFPITTFYIKVDAQERIKRMLKRGDPIDQIQQKIAIDKEKFKKVSKVVDYSIENKDLSQTVDTIIELAKK